MCEDPRGDYDNGRQDEGEHLYERMIEETAKTAARDIDPLVLHVSPDSDTETNWAKVAHLLESRRNVRVISRVFGVPSPIVADQILDAYLDDGCDDLFSA